MNKTLIVNLIGGQGCGKSTIMSNLFSWLKWHNIDCEMCSEFAKELVWEERHETFKDEMYIFAKQNHRLFRCNNKVDVIITDRPLIMSIAYNRFYGNKEAIEWNESYENIVLKTFNQYNNYNIVLNRIKPYNNNGRNETEDEAKRFDILFRENLEELGINYEIQNGEEKSVEIIGEKILKILKMNDEEN